MTIRFGQAMAGILLVGPVEVLVSVSNLTSPMWQDWFEGCVLTKFDPGKPIEITIKVNG